MTSLRNLCVAVEGVLIKNNVTWRYVSSRDVKNLLLEDGEGTIFTIRYSKGEHQNYFHITKPPEFGVNLETQDYFIQDEEDIKGIVEDFLKYGLYMPV